MTEPKDDALEPLEPAGEAAAEPEDAADLTDAQLAAATDFAEAEVDEDEADEERGIDDDAEGEEDDFEPDELEPAPPPRRLSARERAEEYERRGAAAGRRGPREPKAQRTQFPIDPALRIKDPVSSYYVAGSIAVFVLILLYAMAFGHQGAFTPRPTPRPTPAVTAAPSVSASPGASGSAAPSASVAPTAMPTAAPTGAPTAVPTAAPTQ